MHDSHLDVAGEFLALAGCEIPTADPNRVALTKRFPAPSFPTAVCYPSRSGGHPRIFGMSLLRDIFGHVGRTVTAYAGDKALMLAAVSAAANVIVADGEVASEEFDTALAGIQANPILEKGYDRLMLETELYDGIARARTRAGRAENLRRVAGIRGRDGTARNAAFLIAADVADHDGISALEATALDEIAEALGVDRAALLEASPVRRPLA